MKWNQMWKKVCAFALAAVTVGTSAQFSFPASAAPANGEIYFEDRNDSSKTNWRADVIAGDGETATIITKLPTNYAMDAGTPFRIFSSGTAGGNGADVTEKGYFKAGGSPPRYTMNIFPDKLYGDNQLDTGVVQYTLEAYYTTPEGGEGTGHASWKTPIMEIPKDDGTTEQKQYNYTSRVEATAKKTPPLITDSSVSFTVKKASAEDAPKIESSSIHATGYYQALLFSGTNNTTPPDATVVRTDEGGVARFTVIFYNVSDTTKFAEIAFALSEIAQDTELEEVTISATFTRPYVNSLTLAVHTPQNAVELEASNLQGSKENAKAEDGTPYLTLAAGDSLGYDGGIGSSTISVREQVPRYNSKIYIDWAFEVDLDKSPNASSQTVTWTKGSKQIKILEPPEDVFGSLIATFYYLKPGQSVPDGTTPTYKATIPIKVMGAGSPAKVTFLQYKQAAYNMSTTPPAILSQPWKDLVNSGNTFNMEVYDGSVDTSTYMPDVAHDGTLNPYMINGEIDFGKSKSAATKVVVEQKKIGNSGGVRLSYNDAVDYQWGNDIQPPTGSTPTDPVSIAFTLQAIEAGNVQLTFKFYNRQGEQMPNPLTVAITITDVSPDPDPSLRALDLEGIVPNPLPTDATKKRLWETFLEMYPDHMIQYGFKSDIPDYNDIITIPSIVEEVTLNPIYTVPKNTNKITVTLTGGKFDDGASSTTIKSGEKTPKIKLETGIPVTARVSCVAQNGFPLTYTLTLLRSLPSSESALQNIIVKPALDSEEADYYQKDTEPFDPEVTTYTVHVPYAKESVYVQAIAKDPWATKIEFTQDPVVTRSLLSRVAGVFQRQETYEAKLQYVVNNDGTVSNITTVTITVTAEDGTKTQQYKVRIIRDEPSQNAFIKEPKVSYWLKNDRRTEHEAPLDESFLPTETQIFTQMVEYSTNKIKLVITPDDYRARTVTVTCSDGQSKPPLPVKAVGQDPQPLEFIFNDVKFPDDNLLVFQVVVSPESDALTPPPTEPLIYYINVERKPPSRNTNANVTLTNMITNAGIDFAYRNTLDTYPEVAVEYAPGDMRVLVKVEPEDEKSSVTVNGNVPRAEGTEIQLAVDSVTTVTIVITPEDEKMTPRTITIPIRFKGPSKNCYLSGLDAGGFKYLPDFTPFSKTKTSYKIEIPKGIASFPVTATLLKDGSDQDSSNATITINGVPVEDAAAYTFQPSDKSGKIEVVVTAQDGKTKRTYTINYKNWNLMNPGTDNTLKDLTVDYGDMQPEFTPNTQEYDVYVKPDAMNLKIYPKLKDPDGEIRVVAGKVLTEFDGYYSTSLMDDDMDITIYVWSEKDVVDAGLNSTAATDTDNAPTGEAAGTGTNTDMRLDKAKARQYVLHVYRNDDEKIGNLKPITADMVDFDSADPIVIDITKYAVISADVFNTLKTDYADKSILFKGNDYTLQVFGADINVMVPSTDTFDLKFSFYTPDQDKIEDLIDDIGSNSRIDPVYYYFNQHGALPAEMLLTVNLGRHYRNQNLYWNYYNQDRERIDYYGYVHTNATGTFSVPLSHFSTYLSTEDKIRGAENKSDEYGNPAPASEENLNAPGSANKAIPNTGVGG